MKIIKLKNETTGEEKEIEIPAGFDYNKIITRNKSFKDYDGSYEMSGFSINDAIINELNNYIFNYESNKDIFATKELAESALALAQLSQIIEHDAKLSNLHVNKKEVSVNFLKVLRKQHSNHYVVTVEYNYDKKGIDCSYISLETYVPFNSMIITDLFLHPNNYLTFLAVSSEIEIIKDFVKENEELIRKYLMV